MPRTPRSPLGRWVGQPGKSRSQALRATNSRYRRLRVEPLEDRRLLAVVTVNTEIDSVDDGDGLRSLREAIAVTNTFAGTDEIVFDFGHDGPATIVLTQGELRITDSLTINGPGAQLLTIDASGNDPTPDVNNGDGSRVFNIDDGQNERLREVIVRSMKVTGGDATSDGGGIRSAENLTIADSTIDGNSSAARGGGIDSHIGALRVQDSLISGNSARFSGGGVAVRSANTYGPATTNATIIGSSIIGNLASGGGGISSYTCYLAVINCTISGNATGGQFSGGGGGIVAVGRGSLTVIGSTLDNNSSGARGGAINARASALVVDSLISDNTAGDAGGGISVDGGRLTLVTSTITGNESRLYGGGIYSSHYSYVSVTGSTISSNTTGGFGGGIQNGGSTLNVTSSTITNNSAGSGGGIARGFYFFPTGVVSIVDSTISGNTASNKGGGVFTTYEPTLLGSAAGAAYGIDAGATRAERGKLVVSGTTISGNFAPLGGGIWTADGAVSVTNSTISGNMTSGAGGGLYWNPFANIDTIPKATISYSTIAFNSAQGPGGGIFVAGGPLALDHTIVARNYPDSPLGNHGITGPDLTGTVGTVFNARFSLVGNSRDSGLTPAPVGSPDAKGNLIGGTVHDDIDPLLAPLSKKGGPTATHELLVGSPAIDAGSPTAMSGANYVPNYDQRGAPFRRIAEGDGTGGARIDIGAFERQTVQPPLPGDYNTNGTVDAADYVVWRNTLGATVPAFTGADGNGDGVVNQLDRDVWRANCGRTIGAGEAASEEVGVAVSAVTEHPHPSPFPEGEGIMDPYPLATNASRRRPSRPRPEGEVKSGGPVTAALIGEAAFQPAALPVRRADASIVPTWWRDANRGRAARRDHAILAWYATSAISSQVAAHTLWIDSEDIRDSATEDAATTAALVLNDVWSGWNG